MNNESKNAVKITEFQGEYRFLSNFWPCTIEYEGLIFGSVEAAYQAMKTLDMKIRKLFTTYDARTAKKEGKKLTIRDDWDDVKEPIMAELVMIKFAIPELKQRLLNTDDAELIEGNTWGDIFWGICDGIGKNRLGIWLMQVREHYKLFG